MKLSDFDYLLSKEYIAQEPSFERDKSRLLILDRKTDAIEHSLFYMLPNYLKKGDVLIANNTKVIPARLFGKRKTGGKIESLLIRNCVGNQWEVLLDTPRKLKVNETLIFDEGIESCIINRGQDGKWLVEFNTDILPILNKIGKTPLPPYIKRKDYPTKEDVIRYQTVYADKEGSIAAPTAGLHFTKDLLHKLKDIGIEVHFITLHVGIGTFKPIKTKNLKEHKMEEEYFEIAPSVAEAIKDAKNQERRIIAVGTTTCRALEGSENLTKLNGWSDLFIYPPFKFKIVDSLITNFHLPRSTLLLLVCAFAGRDKIFKAYESAKEKNYRFYSYGDAMLIV